MEIREGKEKVRGLLSQSEQGALIKTSGYSNRPADQGGHNNL